MSLRHIFAYLLLFATSPMLAAAPTQVHLLGFVEQLSPDRPYCFELRVEHEYVAIASERINVRYEAVTTIFDPENYELTLQQSNIIPGSHLRLLMTHDPDWVDQVYQANYIWIGD